MSVELVHVVILYYSIGYKRVLSSVSQYYDCLCQYNSVSSGDTTTHYVLIKEQTRS